MLFDSSDIAIWESVLAQYPDALQHHVANKKDDSLLALDEWYQTTLPSVLDSRKPKRIDSEELCRLMSWKLKRGKFRPSLAKLAASNADADVMRISQEAFALVASNLKAAITKMADLKGVGPATASAILCAGAPSEVPFMADETMDSVPGLGTIAYTIPYYLKFATKVIEKAALLKAKGSTTVHSPHLVEKALWADYMLDKYNVQRKNSRSASEKPTKSGGPSAATEENKGVEKDERKATSKEGSNSSSSSNSKRKAPEEPKETVVASGKKAKNTRTKATTATSTRTTRSRT
ncbi:hypothetical protein EDD21DRAFT_415415 [Dissophora ornata]|nr:hypothetical protein BGZ58_001742 [Dissophora ornata]KAI8600916.1 hypothetical protein EDD21DRAFT_415415 [Dissophora ornata]